MLPTAPAPVPTALALAGSPLGGGPSPAPMGYAPMPSQAASGPAPVSTISPPGDAQDAMGTPEGAIVGTPMEGVSVNRLAQMVNDHFETARMAKMEQESVWERCHQNYRGTQPRPANEQAMKLKSKVTMKITRTKVAAAVARLKEIGFKFDVKPTPEPNLIDFSPEQLRAQLQSITGRLEDRDLAAQISKEMNADDLIQQVRDLARERCYRMKTRIDDDFVEMRWDAMYDQGLLDDCLYGTMIFMGPLTKDRRPGRWIRKNGVWGFLDVGPDVKLYRPELENISPWDFYPSPGAWMVEKLDWAIVRNVMGQREVADLADHPGFDRDEVFAALNDQSGRWVPQPWEHVLFTSNNQNTALATGMPNKFEIRNWWGYIRVKDLKDYGGKISKVRVWNNKSLDWEEQEPNDEDVVIANIWVCGNHVLKAWSTNLKPQRLPFYVIPYERIPKSIWGQGVAWMMEDWQAVMNTVYRAMIDNMAISAMPLGWFDRSRLRADDKGDLFPGKMFEVKDTERLTIPPVQFYFPPNNVAHMRMIAEIGRANIQESTSLPDLVSGYQTGATHNRTAAGMSMLGGWADTATRSVQKNIDQEGTRPIVRALYFWEMQFSKDDSIKGDFDVEALGVDSVMADEVLTQRMVQWGGMMQQNPQTAQSVNWKKYGDLTAQKMGIRDEGLMFSQAEVMKQQQAQAEMQNEMAAKQQQQQASLPSMSEKDWLLKLLDRVPEDSPIMAPLLRRALQEGQALTPEINAAINAVNQTNAQLFAGQLSEADRAALEVARANSSPNAPGSQPSGNPGGGGTPGPQAPGGPLPGQPA